MDRERAFGAAVSERPDWPSVTVKESGLDCIAAMHELSIARSIIQQVQGEMARRPGARLLAVHVRVGGLSHVEPENLAFCYEALGKGTELEGSRLLVKKVAVEARCRRCGRIFEVVGGDFRCPDCGVADVELSGHDELTLTGIEVETDGEEESGDGQGPGRG